MKIELYYDGNYTLYCDVEVNGKKYIDPMIDSWCGEMVNYEEIIVENVDELDDFIKKIVENTIINGKIK